jgi:hypothetical protein
MSIKRGNFILSRFLQIVLFLHGFSKKTKRSSFMQKRKKQPSVDFFKNASPLAGFRWKAV